MKNYNWFMGVDVSKRKLDFTLLEGSEKRLYSCVENTVEGIKAFIAEVKTIGGFDLNKCLVCAEHTGIYNSHLLSVSQEQKWDLCLEAAIHIKQSGGLQRGKNDLVDSYRIALYAFKNQAFIKLWQPSRGVINRLKKLSGMRLRLINARKQLTQVMREDGQFLSKKEVKELSKCCQKTLAAIEKDIEQT